MLQNHFLEDDIYDIDLYPSSIDWIPRSQVLLETTNFEFRSLH